MKQIKYYTFLILHYLTLGVVNKMCPVCKDGFLVYGGMDEEWVEFYECDECGGRGLNKS